MGHLDYTEEFPELELESRMEKMQVRPRSKRLEKAITSIPIFQNMTAIDRQELASLAKLHIYPKGEIILNEGDPGRSLYVILDGQVRSFTHDYQGNMIVLETLGHDQFFGVRGMLSGPPRTTSVIATEESLLAEFPFQEMQEFLDRYPPIRIIFEEYSQNDLENTVSKREEAGAEDRRLQPRFNVKLPVRLIVIPDEDIEEALTEEVFRAKSKDISLSGIRLETKDPSLQDIPLETSLKLEIEFPEKQGKIQALGKIRNRFYNEEMNATFLGIQFFKLSAAGMIRLKELLYG